MTDAKRRPRREPLISDGRYMTCPRCREKQDILMYVPMGQVELGRVRKKFGMVFQMSALFDSMSVFDNVAFPLREHTRMSRREMKERVVSRLEALGVGHAVNKMPAELSGGMK